MDQLAGHKLPARRVWPFFSTPFRVFGGVIGPIAGMMGLLAAMPRVPGMIRLTAGLVLAVSVYALYRGYGRRIIATGDSISFRSLTRAVSIPWTHVQRMGRYVPLDRNLQTQYVYITRRTEPPVDWREIDADTIQLQDRPGLLEELETLSGRNRLAGPHGEG